MDDICFMYKHSKEEKYLNINACSARKFGIWNFWTEKCDL